MQRTGRFHTHANRFRQVAIELVRFSVLVFQTALDELACLVIQHRDLLIARVKITSYNLHCSAPLFRALVASATKFTREKEPTTSSNQPGAVPTRCSSTSEAIQLCSDAADLTPVG